MSEATIPQPPTKWAESKNELARQRGWNEPYLGISDIQKRLEKLADKPIPKPRSNSSRPIPTGVSGFPHTIEPVVASAEADGEGYSSDRTEQALQIFDDIQGHSDVTDTYPDTLPPSTDTPEVPTDTADTPPASPAYPEHGPISGARLRTPRTVEGADQWGKYYREKLGRLPPDERAPFIYGELSMLSHDIDGIPPDDEQTRQAFTDARAMAEAQAKQYGLHVDASRWQGRTAAQLRRQYNLKSGQMSIIPSNAQVIEVASVGVYPDDQDSPVFSGKVKMRGPDGKTFYALVKRKNKNVEPSLSLSPSSPAPVESNEEGDENGGGNWIERLSDFPGVPGLVTAGRFGVQGARRALGNVTRRVRRDRVQDAEASDVSQQAPQELKPSVAEPPGEDFPSAPENPSSTTTATAPSVAESDNDFDNNTNTFGCPHCGSANSIGTHFCGNCGAFFSGELSPSSVELVEEVDEEDDAYSKLPSFLVDSPPATPKHPAEKEESPVLKPSRIPKIHELTLTEEDPLINQLKNELDGVQPGDAVQAKLNDRMIPEFLPVLLHQVLIEEGGHDFFTAIDDLRVSNIDFSEPGSVDFTAEGVVDFAGKASTLSTGTSTQVSGKIKMVDGRPKITSINVKIPSLGRFDVKGKGLLKVANMAIGGRVGKRDLNDDLGLALAENGLSVNDTHFSIGNGEIDLSVVGGQNES